MCDACIDKVRFSLLGFDKESLCLCSSCVHNFSVITENFTSEDFDDCVCNADKGSFCSCKGCARRFCFLAEKFSPEDFDERLRSSSGSENESGNVCLRNLYIIIIVWIITITRYVFSVSYFFPINLPILHLSLMYTYVVKRAGIRGMMVCQFNTSPS